MPEITLDNPAAKPQPHPEDSGPHVAAPKKSEKMTIKIVGSVTTNDGDKPDTARVLKGKVELPTAEAERLLAIGPHVAVRIDTDDE